MSWFSKAKDKVLAGWKWVTTPFRKASAYVGGPAEKRNLLGSLIDLAWGCITLPFTLAWGLGSFAVMLTKDPARAVKYAAWQAVRFGKAAGSLLHLVRKDPDGSRHFDGSRIMIVIYLWLMTGFLGVILASTGIGFLVPWLMGAGLIAFIASGVPGMIAVWRETSYEDWEARVEKAGAEATQDVIMDRINTIRETQEAVKNITILTEQYEAVLAERAATQMALKEAMALLAAAKEQTVIDPDHQIGVGK